MILTLFGKKHKISKDGHWFNFQLGTKNYFILNDEKEFELTIDSEHDDKLSSAEVYQNKQELECAIEKEIYYDLESFCKFGINFKVLGNQIKIKEIIE